MNMIRFFFHQVYGIKDLIVYSPLDLRIQLYAIKYEHCLFFFTRHITCLQLQVIMQDIL